MKRHRLQVGRSNDLTMHRSLKRHLVSPWQSPRAFRYGNSSVSPKFSTTSRQTFFFPPSPESTSLAPVRALLQRLYGHRTDYARIVRELDQRRSGAIHAEDLATVVTAHGFALTPSEAAGVIASVTTAGILTARELKTLLTERNSQRPSRAFILPRVVDPREKRRQELKVLLSFLSLSKDKVTELFLTQDTKGTGKVTYDQYLHVMNSLNIPYKFVNGQNLKAVYTELGGHAGGLYYMGFTGNPQEEPETLSANEPAKTNLSKTVSTRKTSMQRTLPSKISKTPGLVDETRVVNRCHNPSVKFYLPRDGDDTYESFHEPMNYGKLKHFLEEVTDKILKGFGYDGFVLKNDGFISKHDIICLLKSHRISFDQKELDRLLPEAKDKIISLVDLNMRVTGRMYALSNG